jgi:tRNA pseudouridine38-40 synthase
MMLRLAYEGTRYHGFARQGPAADRDALVTIQGELERALAVLYKQTIETRGASRTDAGVHASGQLVAFDPPFSIPARGLVLGLASLLPADIVALAAWTETREGGAPVQPRFENRGKHYRYRIRRARLRNLWTAGREWQFTDALELPRMRAAAAMLVGLHDFAGFRASGCQAATTIRRITSIELEESRADSPWPRDPNSFVRADDSVVIVDVYGEAFLQNMVRIIVGTLVEVGRGMRTPASMHELLVSPDRRRSGVTAPARGLTLVEVFWPRTVSATTDA